MIAAAAEKVARFDQVTRQLEEQSDIVRQSVYLLSRLFKHSI